MSTARAGALKRQGEIRPGKEARGLAAASRPKHEAEPILFSIAGTGGVPGSTGGRVHQDRYLESEAQAEPPYWATWSLI